MGRKEFMEQLAALLGDISPQEREEALDYYERYFDEAGDDLQQAIDHLGSPQKVAQDIKSGLKGEYFYTETVQKVQHPIQKARHRLFMWRRKRKATEQKHLLQSGHSGAGGKIRTRS